MLLLAVPATRARADFSQDFESDTSGWFPSDVTDTVNQEADGYVSPVPYASGVVSASPMHHARLRRPDQCDTDTTGSIGPSVVCPGPFTRWGGYNNTWQGGYTTQVDVYLDTDYARANPDSINGNLACLTADATDITCKGTRFDFTSAINDANGNFFQDYAFDVGTGNPSLPSPCDPNGGFVVIASTNLDRSGANIYDPGNDPFCIADSGWYTLKHTFADVGGFLQVRLEIFQLGNPTPLHAWTISPGKSIAPVPGDPNQPGVGCNRYGWFADQEIWDLAIDNSIMVGCGAPPTTTTVTTTTTTTTLEPTTTVPTTTSTTTTTLDHFQCYETKPAAAMAVPVTAQDQFGTLNEIIRYPHRLCAPADKNDEAPDAITHPDHLTGYRMSGVTGFTRQSNLTLVNQFGSVTLDATRPDVLMVPTAKSVTGPPSPLTPPTIDHFQCYKVKRSRGAAKFTTVPGVKVTDQFGTVTLDVIRPLVLCAPANKNGEDPTAPSHPQHLLCYKTRGTKFGTLVAHILNQYEDDQVLLIHRRELCVPSSKSR